ncbi:MAG: hypothetical protein ACQEQV_10610, partial [Fibrobacterota bacterium]
DHETPLLMTMEEQALRGRIVQTPTHIVLKKRESRTMPAIRLNDLSGRMVRRGNGVGRLRTRGLAGGMYLLQIEGASSALPILVE